MLSLVSSLALKWKNLDWTEAVDLDKIDTVSDERLVVVGGCARSGTTLTRVILDSHRDLLVGPPTNVFIPTSLVFVDIADKLSLSRDLVLQLGASSPDRVVFIEALARECRAHYGKKIWGEKTARNVHRFGWILRHFPQARILHVIRDGRDVICSLRTHRRRQVVDGFLQPLENRMPLELCVDRWLNDVRAGLAHRGDERYMEVRYEDLVSSPREQISQVCEFIGIESDDNMIKFERIGGPLRDPLKFPQNLEATLPLYSSAVGRWRRDLNLDERAYVENRTFQLLEQLGY